MSQKMNPTYGTVANSNVGEFSIVTHVPELPSASRIYKDTVLFNKQDACFYHCVKLKGLWKWEKVSFGINRRYVLSTNVIPTENESLTIFNNICSHIQDIITQLAKYGDEFEQLGNDVTEEEAMNKFNELVDHVNRVCSCELSKADSSDLGDRIPRFAEKLNALILELNPHAEVSIASSTIDSFRGVIQAIASNDSLEPIDNSTGDVTEEDYVERINALTNMLNTVINAAKGL